MKDRHTDELLSAAKQLGYGIIKKYIHDECFTTGAFDNLLKNINGEKAYKLLTKLCAFYNEIKSDILYLKGFIFLLESLAPLTDTTEPPPGMTEIISDNPDLSAELKRWYRIK